MLRDDGRDMAMAVGLQHRPELRAASPALQQSVIVRQVTEVDERSGQAPRAAVNARHIGASLLR